MGGRAISWMRRGGRCGLAAGALVASTVGPASAQDGPKQPGFRREAWSGAEATYGGWATWAGSTYAPAGRLDADGLRFRSVSGQGRFQTLANRFDPSVGVAVKVPFQGASSFSDLLVGWQTRSGPLTVKGFIGLGMLGQMTTPIDVDDPMFGRRYGMKVVIETWYAPTAKHWVALDLSNGQAFDARAVRLRAGYRVWMPISVGVDLSAEHTVGGNRFKAGSLVRYDWGRLEVTLGGGVVKQDAVTKGGYATAQALVRF